MLELWTRKGEMEYADENDVEDTSEYEKRRVRPAWVACEDLLSGWLHGRSGLVPARLGIVNSLAQEILPSPSFSWWFAPSPAISLLLILNSTIS